MNRVKDEYRGETVKAYVSVKEGVKATPTQIIEHCKSRMAAYKYPRIVEIIDEVPKNLSGKILRRELRVLHGILEECLTNHCQKQE